MGGTGNCRLGAGRAGRAGDRESGGRRPGRVPVCLRKRPAPRGEGIAAVFASAARAASLLPKAVSPHGC